MRSLGLLVVLLVSVVTGLPIPRAHAVPLPPAEARAEWQWEATPVHHELDPAQASAHPPHVPADAARHTGPVEVGPGRAALVWIEAFGTVRVRVLAPGASGRPTFTRLQPGAGRSFARIEEPGRAEGEGTWWLRSTVGRGEAWLVQSDRRLVIAVERPVPRMGDRIWEHVHDATLAWIEGEGALPRLPAVAGGERYLRRRLADRELAEELRRLPGYDEEVERAVIAWRLHRASRELDALRSLAQRRDVRPSGAPTLEVPHLDDPMAPDGPAEAELVRLSAPWSFGVRGPSVLRLRIRALLPAEGPSSRPIEVVVTTRAEDGREVIVARLDANATALRVRDPARGDAPIPAWVDAVARSGERVSKEHVLAVPLRAGRHEYRVESRRGDVALRAELGRVLARAHGRDAPQWRERLRERALARLAERATPAAAAARALLTEPWQEPVAWPEALDEVPRLRAALELEALAREDATADARAARATRITRGLPRRSRPDPLDVELRVQAFEQQRAAGRSRAAVETLRDVAGWLDGDELPALVAAVEDPASLWPLEGALDVVAHRAPLTARLRHAYVQLWTWTRWIRLHPITEAPAWEWIEPPRSDDAPATRSVPGRVSSLPLGEVVELVAPPHPFEPNRTPLLRILARSPRAVDGVLALEVDGQRWSAPLQDRAEVLEVAVPVGTHRVRLDAPAGVEAFSSLHPVTDPSRPSRPGPVLTTMWPARWQDRPVRFELGALPRDTLAELDMRVVGMPEGGDPPPVELAVCFDDGSRRRVWIEPGPASRELLAVTGPAASSDRARVVVPVPRHATQLWIEPVGNVTLAVSAKLRRWETPEPATTTAARGPGTPSAHAAAPTAAAPLVEGAGDPRLDPYERLAASTRRVAAEPAAVSLRLEHAHRLLDAGDVRRARHELTRVLERHALGPSDPQLAAVRALAARIDAFVDDAFVELGPAAPEGPLLLQPAIAALDPADLTRPDVLAAAAAAREGRLREAVELQARAHVHTGALAPGYAAALAYAQALAAASPDRIDPELERLQPLVYGITAYVRRTVDTPKLRRLHHQLVSATRWEPLQLAERSAGARARGVETAQLAPSDAERLQWALLAPPWSLAEARLLRAGSQAVIVLELPQPRELEIEAFCDDLEATTPTDATPSLELRVGSPTGATSRRTLATTARAITRARLPLPPGAVRLELELPRGRAEQRCAVRWAVVEPSASRPSPERPKQWLLALPRSPVEAIVLGPTTLQLEVEPVAKGTATTVTVELAGPRGEEPRAITGVTPGEPATILVPQPGPRRVVIRTADADLLVRLALRRDAGEAPLAAPEPDPADAPTASRPAATLSLGPAIERARILWPAGPDARPHERIGERGEDRSHRLGSFEAALGYSHTDLAEADTPRPRDQLRGSALWRRELWADRLWLALATHAQGRTGAGAAGGGGATVYAQRGPRRLRGSAAVAAWSERYAGAPAWSLRASLHVDRPLELVPAVVLVPYVQGSYVHQSLDEPSFRPEGEPSHPTVYSPYLEDHPLALTPGVRVRWFPFQDLQLVGEVSTTPNSDLATIDHVDSELGLQGIVVLRVPLLVRYGGAYGASLRLEDEDRPRTFLRHGPRLGAGLTWVVGELGRLNLDIHDTLYLARPFATRNGLDVILSFELTLGRGVRDTAPMEMLFRPQYRHPWWRPAPSERAR